MFKIDLRRLFAGGRYALYNSIEEKGKVRADDWDWDCSSEIRLYCRYTTDAILEYTEDSFRNILHKSSDHVIREPLSVYLYQVCTRWAARQSYAELNAREDD